MRLKSVEASAMLNELFELFFVSVAIPAGAVEVRVPCVELWLPEQAATRLTVVPK
jgi:hypothetical protein